MAITLAAGTQVAIASSYGPSVNMTALTNATEAVATLASGHLVVVGDYLEITSGWNLLNGRIVRVKAVSTNDATLEGYSTSNTTKYPAGTGTGTIRRITGWTTISQVKASTASGGDPKFVDTTSWDDTSDKQMPTGRTATSQGFDVFDDPSLPWFAVVTAAAESIVPTGLRFSFANGGKLVQNGYWSIGVPKVETNQPLVTPITFSSSAQHIRYAT